MPEKVHGIELYSCDEYQTMRRHWNGCGLILHELCHLLHQLVLRDGLDNGPVKEVYDVAMHSRKYEQVLRRDWANLPCETDQAYATINHKEFFAELSVTFLSTGYTSLDGETGQLHTMKLCSPPLMTSSSSVSSTERSRTWWDILVGRRRRHNEITARRQPHCNKFFPFTKGQLQQYDPLTWFYLRDLWAEIGRWEDPEGFECCFCRTVKSVFKWCPTRVGEPDWAVVRLRNYSINNSDTAEYNLLLGDDDDGDDSSSSLEFPDSVSL